jgi:hypothetical protein
MHMRTNLLILSLFITLILDAQDTISFTDLYSKEGIHHLSCDRTLSDCFWVPNEFLTTEIYHKGELFTGCGKFEGVSISEENGREAVFIADIINGQVQKVLGTNFFGECCYRYSRCENDSILARDTIFVFRTNFVNGGYEVIMQYTRVIFIKNGERFFMQTDHESYKESHILTYFTSKCMQVKRKYITYGKYEWECEPGNWSSRITNDKNKTAIVDSLINNTWTHLEFIAGQKTQEVTYYQGERKKHAYYFNGTNSDTLESTWHESGGLKYVELKDGLIREWYENGQMKSEQIKNENGQLVIRKWDENGNLIREK